ncbi:MAG: YlxM family DNA-binding protein [Clostridiales bacterium]|nr:YlxM family DNA-binding protein [Clostridiales bacterium]
MLREDSGDTKLDEFVRLSVLYDFYGELLNDRKKQIFEDYFLNDFSLSEIANELGISRQGVHDIVKRTSKELWDYEERLSLVKKFTEVKEKVGNIKKYCNEVKKSLDFTKIQAIETLADDILKEL